MVFYLATAFIKMTDVFPYLDAMCNPWKKGSSKVLWHISSQ
jgi:hypothetical protein